MSQPGAGRETSGATTGGLLRFVRARRGDEAVAEVIRRAGVAATPEELDDQSRWWTYEDRIALFAATTEVLDHPRAMFDVGAAVLQTGLAHSLVLLLRAMGSPRQVFRQLPRAVQKFSTTSTMEILEAGPTGATIRYRLHDGYRHSRLDCDYTQGLLSTVPQIFTLPAAEITHDECQSDGHAACVYHLTWHRRSRLPWRRRAALAVDPELLALRGQLQILQSAATDLVASEDVDTALERIVSRAAEAVLAPAYLLAVHAPGGGPPLVHGAGLPVERLPELAAALLGEEDLGPGAVVVDIASARRRHGRLAALYRSGDPAMGDEAAMLAAYAGHAAAALDLIIALEEARTEADRAGALLALSHELAAAADPAEVTELVAAALPRVVGCSRASLLLWDPGAGELRASSTAGMSEEQAALLAGSVLRPEDTPELVRMLTDRTPLTLDDATSSPGLRAVLRGIGSAHVVAVPLVAGTTFLGVATAGWQAGEAPASLVGDVQVRLRGVADQATTALQKARLLQTVRHQATHDALTGLPNRVLFLDRLTAAIAAADGRSHVAVLFCDLDRFKQVNDTLGHAAGDELLRQVSARLLAAVRPGDVVGRLSGDEFAVVLPGLAEPSDADGLAARIVDRFRDPFRLEGADARIGTSVGVAVHPRDGSTAEQLLRTADAAMYRRKHADRGAPARG
ncbi:sensor domain-containing diguanylate cyclase [Blastococcus sp. VKM Ac-2987]|uniref:sensor domain-containing diguanylate cyclase n=1 Tax=Blastococcus sp. VKM Ac-2987 TaxID=3004141 RepID=UPI0022ABAB96|nr:sensor domain-containing diguanylate cyclase [Blastococcus sp. VKM Ac-2987]MCZ2859066.1 sensor domain-containing diguanylate cyclase [Blastococcus sp. VKM Ac-2987]